jgi:hypothetical protein
MAFSAGKRDGVPFLAGEENTASIFTVLRKTVQ